MSLLENFLNTVAYTYYAKDLDESDELFLNSKERQQFLQLLNKWSFFEERLNFFLKKIEEKISPELIQVNNTANNFPCFEIEILYDKSGKEHVVMTIYVSFFIPFYHLVVLKGDKYSGNIEYDYNVKNSLAPFIEANLFQAFGYSRFPTRILKNKIPNLRVSEDFNYLNAFFTDYYRITNF